MARTYCLLICLLISLNVSAYTELEIRWQTTYQTTQYSTDGFALCESTLSRYLANNPARTYDGCEQLDAKTIVGKSKSSSGTVSYSITAVRYARCKPTDGSATPTSPAFTTSNLLPTCSPPPTCAEEVVLFDGYTRSNTDTTKPLMCQDGCKVLIAKQPKELHCAPSGDFVCWYVTKVRAVKITEPCSTADPLPPTDPAPNHPEHPESPRAKCGEQGKSYGTVNGVGTCVPRGSQGSEPITTPKEPIINKTTPAATPENPNPEPIETESGGGSITYNPDGTVQENTENSDGSTTETTQSLDEYCNENSGSSECGNGRDNSFTGSCDNFQCDGDAVQCAIAKKQHQDRCDDLKTDTTSDLGKSIIEGTDQLPEPDPFAEENYEQIDFGTIDDSGFVSGGCLPDMTFTYAGKQITFPFSNLCSGFQTAGKIILAFAYLIAARIIFS